MSTEPRVLSAYRPSQPPRAFSDNGVIFHTPGGTLQEWARGYYPSAVDPTPVFWLRRLSDTQRNDAETRLLSAPSLLSASMERERVYIAGGAPTGIPLGVVGGELRWSDHADYWRNGWLAPSGDAHGNGFDGGPAWYPCAGYEHASLAAALFAGGDIEAEGLGWCRIKNGTAVFASRNKRGATNAQARFFLAHGIR